MREKEDRGKGYHPCDKTSSTLVQEAETMFGRRSFSFCRDERDEEDKTRQNKSKKCMECLMMREEVQRTKNEREDDVFF